MLGGSSLEDDVDVIAGLFAGEGFDANSDSRTADGGLAVIDDLLRDIGLAGPRVDRGLSGP